MPFCARVLLGAAGVAAAACSANDDSGYDDPEMDSAELPLKGGQLAPQNAALGSIRVVSGAGGSPGTGGASGAGATPAEDFKCSASLVHPEWVVTTASCFGYQTGTVNEKWQSGVGDTRQVTYAHSVGTTNDAKNIAFGRLSTPSSWPRASIATAMPTQGQTVTATGYGCMTPGRPIFGMSYIQFPFGQTTNFACSIGDEGGPRFNGTVGASPTVLWGLTGQNDGSGVDKVADLVQFGLPYQRGLTAFGATIVETPPMIENPDSAAFVLASRNPNVRAVAGDFDGDGMGDVALFGGGVTPYKVHVAYGGTNRGFKEYGSFEPPGLGGEWALLARSIIAGDFDGDGKSDVALVGNENWISMPVGYSTGRASGFVFQNEPGEQFATWAARPGAYAVAADLSGDGVTDIALVGVSGWTSVPIQMRKPGGVQEVINPGVSSVFSTASQTAGARVHAARLGATSADSLLVIGQPGLAPVVRLSANGTGLTAASAIFSQDTSQWAKAPGAKVIVADFNGDALSDVAFLGPITNPPPKFLPFALNAGGNVFLTAFLPIADYPGWATNARFVLPFHRRWGLTVNDLVLVDVAGGPRLTFPYAELKP